MSIFVESTESLPYLLTSETKKAIIKNNIYGMFGKQPVAFKSKKGETGMSFLGSIKGFLQGESDDDYEYDEYEDEMEMAEHSLPEISQSAINEGDVRRRDKVVPMGAASPLQVVLVKPEKFDDASSIANHLNQKRTVVLNLESANKEISKRLVDFLTGVAYANQANISRVATNTFIITPYNVDLMGGDLLGEMENNGSFF